LCRRRAGSSSHLRALNVADRYLELGLRVGKHVDELVENFYGPEEIKARVDAEERLEPARLVEDATDLLAALETAELAPSRRAWLRAQVTALQTATRRVAGETIPYAEEVELEFGIRPRWHDESDYARAHADLEDALPGSGSVADRLADWIERTTVPADVLLESLRSVADELRMRTERLVGLPDGEKIEVEVVTEKRWSGFNRYCGGLRSEISVNVDLPFPAYDLAYMMAHEGYPGHHAEGVWKETELVRSGAVELTLGVACGAEALLAEGIAELGREIVLGGEEQEVVARVLGQFGIRHDVALATRVQEARTVLRTIRSNLALLLFERGASDEEAAEYVARWALLTPERVAKLINAVRSTPLAGYAHCYSEGLRLARGFVRGDPARFKRLLTEQLVPAELAAAS
jgi:hypothetical protein